MGQKCVFRWLLAILCFAMSFAEEGSEDDFILLKRLVESDRRINEESAELHKKTRAESLEIDNRSSGHDRKGTHEKHEKKTHQEKHEKDKNKEEFDRKAFIRFHDNLKGSRKKKKRRSMMPTDIKDIGKTGIDEKKVDIFGVKPNRRGKCKKGRITGCGEKCSCLNGKIYCCRQRKDWDTLSPAKKKRYVQLVYDIIMGRRGWRLRNEYVRLLYIHERLWYSGIHNKLQFFPWHRIFLLEYENILRKVDCTVTVPYWDWTKKADRWWQSSIFGSKYFGGNINYRTGEWIPGDACVSTGMFSDRNSFIDFTGRCLVRNYKRDIQPASYKRIQYILSMRNFNRFESALRHEHGIPHFMVGGQGLGLFFTDRAAEDPIFFLHHSNVDYHWYQRQVRYTDTWKEYWGESKQSYVRLTGLGTRIGEAVNPFRHGAGNVCVEYVDNNRRFKELVGRKSEDEMGQLKAECSKNEHRFPKGIFTLFKDSAEEIREFMSYRNENGSC